MCIRELGNSLYDLHSDGSGICYSSRLRPVLNMRPKAMSSTAGIGSMLWGYNADTHLIDWLEAEGFAFDVATDEDLHAEGAALLSDYRVVLTGTHPEYYSAAMLQALHDYTARGGRLMYMGGNGFYWRIAYHPTLPGVIEVRRAEDGTRAWVARPGEYYHSFTGEYGGLWRRQNRPPQQLVGTGFIAQGFDLSSPYRRTPESADPRVAFAFEGIGMDETIGGFGLIGGGAAGLEVDIADPELGTPPHALVVASSEELTDTYLLVNEDLPIATPDTMGSAESAHPLRHRVLRDRQRRRGVRLQLDRLVRQPRPQRLRQQRRAPHRQRPAPVRLGRASVTRVILSASAAQPGGVGAQRGRPRPAFQSRISIRPCCSTAPPFRA